MPACIYCIKNNVNNHCYIGQSICIEKRWKAHRITATNPNDEQYNAPLYQAFRKYGIENFTWEVLEETTDDLLDEKEIYYINLYNSFKANADHVFDIYDLCNTGTQYDIKAQLIRYEYKYLFDTYKSSQIILSRPNI